MNTTTTNALKINALQKYLLNGLYQDEPEKVNNINIDEYTNEFEIDGSCFLVLTREEADEKTKEYILETLWAFNAEFILQHTEFYQESTDSEDEMFIKSLRNMQSEMCESANAIVKALIRDIDEFITDAIDEDGRGHFLATYDGEENYENGYYIYQTN